MSETASHPFVAAFRGSFIGILRWPQLAALWETVAQDAAADWYIYAVGEAPPDEPASSEQVLTFIRHMDTLLRTEHDYDYCGIVYVDSREHPGYIKIFDPNNLGVSCGYSDNPPLPGWIMSKLKPTNLVEALPQPGNRKRWWQKLFSTN
ncbi:MAG: hypothetical protein OEZ43_04640 [Gammaproteobacteria bacterium]|nr:hypothetical protein [Gammaproteobacteria bacterium]